MDALDSLHSVTYDLDEKYRTDYHVYGKVLTFAGDGEPIGVFGNDPRIVDPRGLAVNRFWRKAVVGRFVYLRFCIGLIMCPG
jgi:hypothetical protein